MVEGEETAEEVVVVMAVEVNDLHTHLTMTNDELGNEGLVVCSLSIGYLDTKEIKSSVSQRSVRLQS